MNRVSVGLALLVACVPGWAEAQSGCYINTANALACGTPNWAAAMFQRYGRNPGDLTKDYVVALLRSEGCQRVDGNFIRDKYVVRSGPTKVRVATETGWVETTIVSLGYPDREGELTDFWMATAYLSGACPPAFPSVATVPSNP